MEMRESDFIHTHTCLHPTSLLRQYAQLTKLPYRTGLTYLGHIAIMLCLNHEYGAHYPCLSFESNIKKDLEMVTFCFIYVSQSIFL